MKRFILLFLVSIAFPLTRYTGPASKTMFFDSLRVGVSKPFADTLLFQDGLDTIVAPYSGQFRVITPTVHDTLVLHDTVSIPFIVYVHDTSTVYSMVYVDSTLRPPVMNRWVVKGDTILDVKLDSCRYLYQGGRITRKYSCK